MTMCEEERIETNHLIPSSPVWKIPQFSFPSVESHVTKPPCLSPDKNGPEGHYLCPIPGFCPSLQGSNSMFDPGQLFPPGVQQAVLKLLSTFQEWSRNLEDPPSMKTWLQRQEKAQLPFWNQPCLPSAHPTHPVSIETVGFVLGSTRVRTEGLTYALDHSEQGIKLWFALLPHFLHSNCHILSVRLLIPRAICYFLSPYIPT